MKNLKIISFLIILTLCGACSQVRQINERVSNSAAQKEGVNIPRNLKNASQDFQVVTEQKIIVTLPNNTDILYGEDKQKTSAIELGANFEDYYKSNENSQKEFKEIYLVSDASNDYAGLVDIFEIARRRKIYRFKLVVSPNEKAETKYNFQVELAKETKPELIQKPNPLTLVAELKKDGKINLNNESNTLDSLKARLKEVFRNREANGVFREGTNEVYKQITVKAPLTAKYEEIARLIDALKESGASPIILQIDDLSD